MNARHVLGLSIGTLLLSVSPLANALSGITDTAGDFLSSFGGTSAQTDLDVIDATVLFDPSTNLFKLTSTLSGAPGTTPNGVYVWGVNRGAGTAGFAGNGIDGVRFDRVILLRPDGTGQIGGGPALPSGSVTVAGNTISAIVSSSLLTSTGFNFIDYTWNLWPRNTTYAGFAAISDFAPDNANFTSTVGTVVPLPASLPLLGIGMAMTLVMRRRRAAGARI